MIVALFLDEAAGGIGGLMGLLAELEKGIDRRKAGISTRLGKVNVY